MPYLAEEVEIIMNNLIPYFVYEYREEAFLYFTNKAKDDAKDNDQDAQIKQVVCLIDKYLEEEVEDDISIGEA